jgi:hypothetical protein
MLLCCVIGAGCQRAAEPVVDIVAFYPLNAEHQYIADYLLEMEKAHPGEVRVKIYDMQSPEGREEWQGRGLTCAGVFVNGTTRHELTREGKTETVDFIKRMDVFWTRQDFEDVIDNLLQQAEGKPKT